MEPKPAVAGVNPTAGSASVFQQSVQDRILQNSGVGTR
jgi:hypothetical protein